MKLSTEKILLAGISIALVALGALVFNAFNLGHKVNDISYQLEQNRKLINHSESLLLATVNNQSGVRGYVITGNEEFLEPHNKSLPELEKELTALKKLIAQKPALQHYLDSLVFYVQKGIAISDQMITLRRQPGEGEASKLFYTGEGKRYADQIRNFVAILQQNENAELQRSQTKNERAVKNLQKSFAWISAVIVSIVILYVLKVRYDISYHKKTEKKLKNFNAELEQQVKEKTEEIKNVFERIADGFIAVDRNWHYVYGNDKGGELIFRDPRDLIGKNVWEEFPEAKEKFYPVFNRAMETQQYQYLEQYYPPFDRWFEIHLNPSIDGLSIYFKDITGKKKVEAEKRRLAEIIEASTDFVGIAGKDQRMEYMNKAGLQSLKYSSIEEMASKSLVHFLPERFRDSFQNEAVPFIQKYGGWNGETYWMANDGCEIPISVVVLAHKNLKGEIEYYSSVARDITERKKAEGKIKKEKQLSDTLINSLPGVFYLFDDTGKFIRWNKNFETISGYSEEEVRQMHPLEFFDANEKGLIAERIGKVFTDGASDAEASFLTKEGEKIPYFFTGLQLMYEDKKCLLGCGIDLSALKNLERELADEKIAQQKRIMQAMLEAQEAEKNNLGRELHDNINQTLVVVKIYLDIMAGNEQPERVTIAETKKLLENAMKEIRNLSHSLAVNYEFDQGLRVALQYLGDEIQKTKELDIELECDDAIEGLTTSEMKLAIFRIVQEQLSNIIKHAAAKKTLIHLFPENGEMVLRIQDDGNGFDLSKVKKGIGLNNIVLRAETLGGEARIQSSPGKGCRIEIKLPLSQML